MNEIEPAADWPPEYCHYRDEGCELAPACLNCPLPRCVYDEPGGTGQRQRRQRDEDMLRLRGLEGQNARELARRFGVSQRTVYRIVRRGRHG